MEAILVSTDQELVVALQRGESNAFEEIYKRYWSRLYPVVLQRLADREQTEDVLQEIFAYLWVKRETLAIQNLKFYLFAAARYQAIQHLTRNRKPLTFFEPFESLLTEAETPDQKIIAKQLYEWIYRYADTLPAKKREIFLLHIRDKFTTKEIAGKLGISQKTVQNQLGSALHDLRTHITPVILALLCSRL
jgi:RNA polymerase sigma-70 factor (family 1)